MPQRCARNFVALADAAVQLDFVDFSLLVQRLGMLGHCLACLVARPAAWHPMIALAEALRCPVRVRQRAPPVPVAVILEPRLDCLRRVLRAPRQHALGVC